MGNLIIKVKVLDIPQQISPICWVQNLQFSECFTKFSITNTRQVLEESFGRLKTPLLLETHLQSRINIDPFKRLPHNEGG